MIPKEENYKMIKLLNIKKNNSIIECDIVPEDSIVSGHMIVDTSLNMIKSYYLPDGYEWCTSHVDHAKEVMIRMSKNTDIPKEKLIMWC